MSIKSFIKKNRQLLEKEISRTKRWKYFSPAIYAQFQVTVPLAQQYARGRLLDIGCGEFPFEEYLLPHVTEYHGLDYYPRSERVTYTDDVQNMVSIPDESYDTAVCFEVLEHIPNPSKALSEIYRVLKPEGVLIASVPHISRLHDVPHDYYRFTSYGIDFLLRENGFSTVCILPKGGIFSFLGHQLSTLLITPVWGIPIFRDLVFFLNSWLVTRFCFWIDRHTDRTGIMAIGYAFVAKK